MISVFGDSSWRSSWWRTRRMRKIKRDIEKKRKERKKISQEKFFLLFLLSAFFVVVVDQLLTSWLFTTKFIIHQVIDIWLFLSSIIKREMELGELFNWIKGEWKRTDFTQDIEFCFHFIADQMRHSFFCCCCCCWVLSRVNLLLLCEGKRTHRGPQRGKEEMTKREEMKTYF